MPTCNVWPCRRVCAGMPCLQGNCPEVWADIERVATKSSDAFLVVEDGCRFLNINAERWAP